MSTTRLITKIAIALPIYQRPLETTLLSFQEALSTIWTTGVDGDRENSLLL